MSLPTAHPTYHARALLCPTSRSSPPTKGASSSSPSLLPCLLCYLTSVPLGGVPPSLLSSVRPSRPTTFRSFRPDLERPILLPPSFRASVFPPTSPLRFSLWPLCPGTCPPRGRFASSLFALAPSLCPVAMLASALSSSLPHSVTPYSVLRRLFAFRFGPPLCPGTCSPRGPTSCSSPPTKGASSLLPCLLCYLTSVPLSLSPFFSQSDPPIQPPSVISS